MKENKSIVEMVKKINLLNFKITEKEAEEDLLEQKEKEFMVSLQYECEAKERNILNLKQKLKDHLNEELNIDPNQTTPKKNYVENEYNQTRSV